MTARPGAGRQGSAWYGPVSTPSPSPWTRRTPSRRGVDRGIHASAWDRVRGNLVVHGSGDRRDGGWVLEGATWTWSEKTGWVNALTAPIVALRLEGRLDEARAAAETLLESP